MLFSSPLVPTPAILQDRGLIIQILQRCPAFLRQLDIPPEFFTDRELFQTTVQGILRTSSDGHATPTEFLIEGERYEATVQEILQSSDADVSPSGADVLGLFSDSLRNDFDLALFALRTLRHVLRHAPDEPSFVGWELCHTNANFAVRAAKELAIPPTPPTPQPLPAFANDQFDNSYSAWDLQYLSDLSDVQEKRLRRRTPRRRVAPRRLLDLSDLSECLRNDPAVLTAFCHLDAANFVLAPENWQRDAGVLRAACENCPAAIWQAPPCTARSALESSLPFVVRLLKDTDPKNFPMEKFFEGFPPAIRESREVSLVATQTHPRLVHPRWTKCPDFWCDAIHRTESNLHNCYEQIQKRFQVAPSILDAVVRHSLLCDLRHCSQSDGLLVDGLLVDGPLVDGLLEALLRRVSDRESLRECVKFAQTCDGVSDPDKWSRIPTDLWEDKELSLELLAMIPSLYGCLPGRLQSDPDVVAALLVAKPKYFEFWASLLWLVPEELKLQRPELVLRILEESHGTCEVADDVPPELWHNRDVVLELFRCCGLSMPSDFLDHCKNEEELWLELAGEDGLEAFEEHCPSNFLHDRTFLLRAVRANPGRCLKFFTEEPLLDFDLFLAACVTKPELADTLGDRCYYLVEEEVENEPLNPELLQHIPREVRRRTSRYLSFIHFMSGISSAGAAAPSPSSSSSSPKPPARPSLTLLNQGPETAQVYRDLLAAYVGVPSADRELVTDLSGLKRLSVALSRRGL